MKNAKNTNNQNAAPIITTGSFYMSTIKPIDFYLPTQDQFVAFIRSRGDQFFAMSMECYEMDSEKSAYYSDVAVELWNGAEWTKTLGQWEFNLWFEANELTVYDQIYELYNYAPVVITKQNMFQRLLAKIA